MDATKDTRTDAEKASGATASQVKPEPDRTGAASAAKDTSLAASESRIKDAEDAAARRRTNSTEEREASHRADADAELRRGDTHSTNNPRAPEAVARQHERVDEALKKRSEENAEGHAKNMERAEAEANEAHARTQHADHHLANHVPTGKQNNRNTPRVFKDGTKVWDQ